MRRKPSRLSTGRLPLLRLFSTLLPILLIEVNLAISCLAGGDARPSNQNSRSGTQDSERTATSEGRTAEHER